MERINDFNKSKKYKFTNKRNKTKKYYLLTTILFENEN